MNEARERELRDRFERLRREEADRVPAFRAVLAAAERRRAGRPPARFRLALGVIALAAGVVAVVVGVRLFRAPATPVDLAATRWRGPTDFLLRLPGHELLGTVPRLSTMYTDWRNPL
ncbi:MAG: hypothetical protein ACREL9_05535 [Gemmatimonadales bacterium]